MWLLNWLFALIKSFQEPCGHLFCKIAAEAAHRTCKPSRKVLALSDSMTKRCYFYAFFRPLAKARRKNINWTPFLIEKKCKFWNMTVKTRFSWSSQCWRTRHDDFKMFSDKFYDESLGLAVIAYRLWSALLVGDRGGPKDPSVGIACLHLTSRRPC